MARDRSRKLWQKKGSSLHPLVESFTVGDDYLLDREILPFDIEATGAHAHGLTTIGVLTPREYRAVVGGLNALKKEWATGTLEIKLSDEDCHTFIENYLVYRLGDIGKKVHTGRSRNDQVLTAVRLYMRAALDSLDVSCTALARSFLKKAKRYQRIPMPGYSHTQQAMLSSVGHYYGSFVESLLDDRDCIRAIRKLINKSPLGSAAGFGVSFRLPRQANARRLDFDSVQINSLYCQNSRGKFEILFLEALSQVMDTLTRYANDMVWFTSREFGFFVAPDSLVTGSSIMPQKKNFDALEILRGQGSILAGHCAGVRHITKSLLSGYNRDLQLMKRSIIESFWITQKSLDIAKLFVENLTPNRAKIESSIQKDIFAADVANDLVRSRGIAFRDAYSMALDEMKSHPVDYQGNIDSKKSPGSPGNLCLDVYVRRIVG